MNLRAVGWLLGCVLLLLGGFVLVAAAVALGFGELRELRAFLATGVVCGALGGTLAFANRGSTATVEGQLAYFRREGLAVVGLTWLVLAAAGSLPFLLAGVAGPVDAFFESSSGFTTTGCSILSAARIDELPRSIHFWRCFSHWIGGIGIVLVFVVLFPTGGRSLFRSEVSGIAREATLERVRDSAFAVLRVYVALTAAHVGALLLAGVDPFDALLHAFSTIATGGFSTHGSSVAWFGSWAVEAILIVFMIAAGINFGLWDAVVRQGPRRAWRLAAESDELKLYLLLIAGGTVLCGLLLWFWGGSNGDPASALPDYSSFLLSMRDSAFTITSLQTCTGYATADYDRWPPACRMLVMLAALFGACSGSTGGGIKIVRLVIVARAALTSIQAFVRPRAVHVVRLDGRALAPEVAASATRYFVLWFLVALVGAIVLTLLGSGIETSLSAVIVCLNNAGPGLAAIGPAMDYGHLPDASKLLLSLYMILGRLEFFALLALLVPGFWRS